MRANISASGLYTWISPSTVAQRFSLWRLRVCTLYFPCQMNWLETRAWNGGKKNGKIWCGFAQCITCGDRRIKRTQNIIIHLKLINNFNFEIKKKLKNILKYYLMLSLILCVVYACIPTKERVYPIEKTKLTLNKDKCRYNFRYEWSKKIICNHNFCNLF